MGLHDVVASVTSASVSPVLMPKHDTAVPALSCGEFPVDLHRMRAVLPDRRSGFLRQHFRDLNHVQFFFGVSERTARDWLAGTGSPRAEVALYAVSRFPDALPRLMGAA